MQIKHSIIKNITYASTTATLVGSVPANAIITGINVHVATAFNAGGNDYVDIGDSSTAALYANDVNVASAGDASVTRTSDSMGVLSSTAPSDIYAVYVPAGSTPTAGSAYIVIDFVQL